jgi:hypothetical protein
MVDWRLARAWACYWVMQAIDAALAPWPRSRTKARVINALVAPFFQYGAYWALRSNPNTSEQVKEMERRNDL